MSCSLEGSRLHNALADLDNRIGMVRRFADVCTVQGDRGGRRDPALAAPDNLTSARGRTMISASSADATLAPRRCWRILVLAPQFCRALCKRVLPVTQGIPPSLTC